MPSKEVYETLLNLGIRVDKLSYTRYDSLASEDDLVMLFEVLDSVKDNNANPAIITANTIVANPDFKRIREAGFGEYFYEPFTETLKRYPKHNNSFAIWQQGINAGVFLPQFHGREHLNVKRWMKALLSNVGNVRMAFDHGMFDLSINTEISENSFMEALNFECLSEVDYQKEVIREGLNLFEILFGFKSETFIAPCYTWSSGLNQTLKDSGVKTFQSNWFQFEPLEGKAHRFKKRFHYTGQRNKLGQSYIVRNAAFEPSDNFNFDWITYVMSRAKIAFRMGKPLIIGSHRVNYIGYIDESNRNRNLLLLRQLLKTIVKHWPDVEFMSSNDLGMLINNNRG
jgi:hypothetical protein